MNLTEIIKEKLSFMPNFYDEVRIVDPIAKDVIKIDDKTGEIISRKSTCFGSLSKCEACQNCVSFRALLNNDTFTKIERVEGKKPVRIISTPIKVADKTYILEIIKEVDCKTAGIENSDLNEDTSAMLDDMNKKIVTDGLTSVYNRRFIDERVDIDIYSQRKNNSSYIMAMADIDFFKKVNDVYGHQAGDMILVEVSRIIKATLNSRQCGWVGRYGGEEFVFVCYNKSLAEVIESVEHIRKTIAEKEFIYNDKQIKVTLSFGVAELSDKHKDGKALIKDVDEMLYKAKENGRNRVEY